MAAPNRRKSSTKGPARGPGRSQRGPGRRPGPGSPYSQKPRPGGRPQKRRRSARPPVEQAEHPDGPRLQKVLAAAGLGSRRECEELITTGRVEIDRQVVTQLGTRVDTTKHEVRVDGMALNLGRRLYYAVHKPKGVVSTTRDPGGRPRVVDLVPSRDIRLFTVGRLDLHSEGLILVTNDGDLANHLTHPRYGIQKVYLVQVVGRPEPEVLEQLRRGVHLAEGVVRAESAEIKSHHKDSTWLEIVLREGLNREIRRMLARVGHKVVRILRVAVGPIKLGKLPAGSSRPLTPDEIRQLRLEAKETSDHE